jgi:polysaccharide biosynthesis/export protein VpsN
MLRVIAFVLLALANSAWQVASAAEPKIAVVGKGYELTPGDVIAVEVFGEGELSKDYAVEDSGRITVPLIGELDVSGLTTRQVRSKLIKALKNGYMLDPKVTVSVKTFRQIYVNGQVKSPSAYGYVPGMTVRKLIALAGGFTERASKRRISVISEGADRPRKVKLDDLVKPGDVVTVEESFF